MAGEEFIFGEVIPGQGLVVFFPECSLVEMGKLFWLFWVRERGSESVGEQESGKQETSKERHVCADCFGRQLSKEGKQQEQVLRQ